MSFIDWIQETHERVQSNGIEGATESAYELYLGGLRRLGRTYNYGESIYERPWDVLIVLDACRPDLMVEVESDHEFLSNSGSIISKGSSSAEWMKKNFLDRPHDAATTTYVTGNPFSDSQLRPELFYELDEVWQYGWDDQHGTIPPDPITDRAIYHGRKSRSDRLVVHYMQPHYPFIKSNLNHQMSSKAFGKSDGTDVWNDLRRGEISRNVAWNAYRENLQYVLKHVEILLSNIDADKVVITADHGNLLGEWGIYGHPEYAPIRALKQVPWYVTSADDNGEYDPTIVPKRSSVGVNSDVSERLQELGYQ